MRRLRCADQRRSAKRRQRKSAVPSSDEVAKGKLNHYPALSKRPGCHGNACGRLVKAASGESPHRLYSSDFLARRSSLFVQPGQLACPAATCYDQRLNLDAQESQESKERKATVMTDLTGNTFFEGPAGRIEAILKEPAAPVARAAIVCHPHPLFGGTMHNKVVFRIARAFQDAGFAVLRFNFRGTGRSQGAHDDGRGEQDDLRAAVKFIEEKFPGAELWLAGFSFGSAVMLRAAACDGRVHAIVAAGVPVSKYDFTKSLVVTNRSCLFRAHLTSSAQPRIWNACSRLSMSPNN